MRRLMFFVLILASLPIFSVAAHGEEEYPCSGLLILDPFARPTVTQTGAAYGTFVNVGEDDLTLIGGEVAFAEVVEIHEMMMDGDTMVMNPLADGLVIPSGSAAVLEPGGYHVMFIGVTEEVAEETTVDVTLNFVELDEALTLTIPVRQPVGGMGMGHGGAMEATEEANGDHMMMSGEVLAFGDCAAMDFSEVTWNFEKDGEMGVLHLVMGEAEFKFPTIRIADMMMDEMGHGGMDMNATPESGN